VSNTTTGAHEALDTLMEPHLGAKKGQLYQYTRLSTSTSIRLLILDFASASGDNITSSLKTFELQHAPPYEALSYTWGCPYADPNYEVENPSESTAFNSRYTTKRDIPIACDGANILITLNLKDALLQLRQRAIGVSGPQGQADMNEGRKSYIWIDSICIDQEDIAERRAQVGYHVPNILFCRASVGVAGRLVAQNPPCR